MNYKRIYNEIVSYRKLNPPDGYYENHHIIPRSLGGTDDVENLVRLTAREHFICHYLLIKIHKDTKAFYPMVNAFVMMCVCSNDSQHRVLNSRLFESYRIEFSKRMSSMQTGEKNSQFGTKWYNNPELKISKKFKSGEEVPEGWVEGRVVNWEGKIVYRCECGVILGNNTIKKCVKCYNKQFHTDEKVKLFSEMYSDWNEFGYKYVVEKYKWDKSQPALIENIKRYVVEYVPKQGRKLKN